MPAHTKGTFHCKCEIINCFPHILRICEEVNCARSTKVCCTQENNNKWSTSGACRCWRCHLAWSEASKKKLIPIYDVIKSVFVCKHLHFHTRVSLSLSLGENQCRKKSMILWKEKFNKIEALMWHIWNPFVYWLSHLHII